MFGTLVTGATLVVGSIFSEMTAPVITLEEKRQQLASLPYDARRMASGQQERLSHMIKETVEAADSGASDKHWKAVMK